VAPRLKYIQSNPLLFLFLQNLHSQGHVDEPLDGGMLGMLHDLPEGMAIEALQRFSSIDKKAMRSKKAYLVGLLRRELAGINRR
jgi:hypothetical protein